METFELVVKDLTTWQSREESEKIKKRIESISIIFQDLDRREISPNSFSEMLKRLNEMRLGNLKLNKLTRFKMDLEGKLEKEFKLVQKGHYQGRGMILGMLFGTPLGTVLSLGIDNFAFVGIGIPIGMAVGMAIGISRDKVAEAEGRVLNG